MNRQLDAMLKACVRAGVEDGFLEVYKDSDENNSKKIASAVLKHINQHIDEWNLKSKDFADG